MFEEFIIIIIIITTTYIIITIIITVSQTSSVLLDRTHARARAGRLSLCSGAEQAMEQEGSGHQDRKPASTAEDVCL